MICGQTTADPVVSNVPLSCVPPIRFLESNGLTDRLWNCSVDRPLFKLNRCEGTRESSCWHNVKPFPVRPRAAHCAETSVKSPLERMSPPSEPSKNKYGLPGCVTIACWSGWMPFGVSGDEASQLMSVKLAPASVDSKTPRLFDTAPYSPYW